MSELPQATETKLVNVYSECWDSDWDGHGAEPVTRETIEATRAFLKTLPAGCAQPELGAEPDGAVTLEWRHGKDMLSVSVKDGDSGPAWALRGIGCGSGEDEIRALLLAGFVDRGG